MTRLSVFCVQGYDRGEELAATLNGNLSPFWAMFRLAHLTTTSAYLFLRLFRLGLERLRLSAQLVLRRACFRHLLEQSEVQFSM